jgi:long-subunit fatty acid transport protein
VVDDPSACYWNPAGLVNVKSSAMMLQHNEHYQDLQHEYLAYAAPFGNNGAFGFSVSYLHMGSIMGYDVNDSPTGEYKVYDIAYGLSYGHRVYENISIGLAVKNIRQSIAELKANGWAFDAGMLMNAGMFDLSMVVANFGSAIKYETESFALPTEYRFGVGYAANTYPVIVSAEYGYSKDGTNRLGVGAEYELVRDFSLRGGYNPAQLNSSNGQFAMGCGLKIWGNQIDYSFLPNSELGASHRISAIITFSEFGK